MNTIKLISLFLTGILYLGTFIMLIQVLLQKVKTEAEDDLKIKSAYGIWSAGLLITTTLMIYKTIFFLGMAIDNIRKLYPSAYLPEVLKTCGIFAGFGLVWFVAVYFIARAMSLLFLGRRNEQEEMKLNNNYYFLIRSIVTICTCIALTIPSEIVYHYLTPTLPLFIYH